MKKQINLTILSFVCLLLMAGCASSQAGIGPAPTSSATVTLVASNPAASAPPAAAQPTTASSTSGADLTNFDACSVVNDDEYKSALDTFRVQEGGAADDTTVVRHEIIMDPFYRRRPAGIKGVQAIVVKLHRRSGSDKHSLLSL